MGIGSKGSRFTIVTVAFNAERTIGDTLQSVAEQAYPLIEHIVIDGASTDGTLSIIERQAERVSLLISEPDRGIYDAMNKGLARATGDFVGFLNADDVFSGPNALQMMAELQQDSPTADCLFADLAYVTNSNPTRILREWRTGPFSEAALTWGWMPPHPTFYVRTARLPDVGSFDEGFTIAADYDFMLRCLGKAHLLPAYLPEVLVHMRFGGASNRSLMAMVRKSAEDLRAIRRNQVGGIHTLAMKNLRKLPQFIRRRGSTEARANLA